MEQNETLASELLHELKQTSKRWFIAFLIVVALWFATIAGFVWYISLPVDVSTIEMETDSESNANLIQDSTIQGDITNERKD